MARSVRFSAVRFGLQARLRVVLALAVLAVIGTSVIGLIDMRHQTIDDAQAEMSNLSRSLADQAKDVFQTLDTVLVGLRERVVTDGVGEAATRRLHSVLTLRARSLRLLHDVAVIDASGHVLVSSADTTETGSRAKAAFFRHHRETPGGEPFVGWPIRDSRDGSWVLTVSRRVDRPDGSFAGVVVASVPTAVFRRYYQQFDTGTHGAILLGRNDGILVSRWPMRPQDEARNLNQGELFNKVFKSADQTKIEQRSLVDGIVRFGSYRWVAGAPMFVLAARSKTEVLANWRRAAMLHLAALLGVLSVLYLLARRLSAKIAEGEAVSALLVETNAQLVTSEAQTARVNSWLEMGEQIAQIGNWHLDVSGGSRLTWSDQLYRMSGRDPSSFTLTTANAREAYHPQEREQLSEAVEHAIEAGTPFEIIARLIRPDGTIRHMLTRGVPKLDDQGVTIALYGVVMDITRQKRSETALLRAHEAAETANKALEAANRTLETMAMQDALTGLSNRRHFDRSLEHEFSRAVRAHTSLALIMIDVDYFKPFNDIYGHQAGDSCLRTIAGLIQPLLNRPGDIAARYGGEEVAILLPGNTIEGALTMAIRITNAVRERGVVHRGSHSGVVTISAGVAAFIPVHQQDLAGQLVGKADQALYAAKRGGRDRVVSYETIEAAELPAEPMPEPGFPVLRMTAAESGKGQTGHDLAERAA